MMMMMMYDADVKYFFNYVFDCSDHFVFERLNTNTYGLKQNSLLDRFFCEF